MVFAVPDRKLTVVDASNSQDFIKRFNQNTITKKQIELCNSARRLFLHEGKVQKQNIKTTDIKD